jgi:hypothetical protein
MTRRIRRLLSVPIKPAIVLAIAAQTGMPGPSGYLRTEMGVHSGLFGGLGIPFLHPASMVVIPYLARAAVRKEIAVNSVR